jgi:two-component system chemotaxis sensor kinase CheA
MESEELFEKLETELLKLEAQQNNEDEELVHSVLRATLTLKGSSGMIGPDIVPKYVHAYETVLKSILNNPKKPEGSFNFLLKHLDYIKYLVNTLVREKGEINQEEYAANVEKLNKYEFLDDSKKEEYPTDAERKYGFFNPKLEAEAEKEFKEKEELKHKTDGSEEPQATSEPPKTTPEDSKTTSEPPKTTSEDSKATPEDPQVINKPEAATSEPPIPETSTTKSEAKTQEPLKTEAKSNTETKSNTESKLDTNYYRITMRLLEKRSPNSWSPEDIIDEIEKNSEIINAVTNRDKKIENLNDIDFYQCHYYWVITIKTALSKEKVRDIFVFYVSENISIDVIKEEDLNKLGEILLTNGVISKTDLEQAVEKQEKSGESQKKLGEILVEDKKATPKDVSQALKAQEKAKKVPIVDEEIRISTKKIDWLIDLVGELVIANSNLSNVQQRIADIDLDQIQYNINKISRQMRDTILSLKMVPIGQLLTKYFRMVRDLSLDCHKKIDLLLEGEGTELDKSMFDSLQEPLLHIIRNSVDHGIEIPEDRIKIGKPENGSIIIRSYHENGQIIIEIFDDGGGLDKNRILSKAIKKGILKENVDYSDDEIYKVIFESGFSTNDEITLISGRGVGMDAVMAGIKKLKGSIRIKTEANVGTTFIIQLPLTLAIIEGFLLRVGHNHFVLPLSFIDGCFEIDLEKSRSEGMVYNLRGEYLSLIELDSFFDNVHYDNDNGKTRQVVTLKLGNGGKLGIVIDEIIGNIQAVIKPLVTVINKSLIITGSTLLGSGEVALILDVANLFDKFKEIKKVADKKKIR